MNDWLLEVRWDKICLHRQPERGPHHHGRRLEVPHARAAGAGRQKPLHRGRNGQREARGAAHRVGQGHQLRPDLRGARLLPRARERGGRLRGAGGRVLPPVLRRGHPGVRRMAAHDQPPPLRPRDGAHREPQPERARGVRRARRRGDAAHRTHVPCGRDAGRPRDGRGDLRPRAARADVPHARRGLRHRAHVRKAACLLRVQRRQAGAAPRAHAGCNSAAPP